MLTTAISQGISPSTTYLSAPFKYDPTETGSCDTNPPTAWCPQTYDHSYIGPTSIENGTLRSDNSVYARLSLDVGPENIADIAYRLGVRTDLRTSDGAYVPSMGLGSRVVTPMDMASVYSTLAAGGVYSKPMAIRKVILPGGKVDTEAGWGVPQRKRAVPDWVAAEVVRILEENMTSGTGVGAYFGGTSAGKTGTTDNYADAWFCGFFPGLEATIWIGYPKGEIPMTSVHGISVSGPTFPATIWKLFMEHAADTVPEGVPVAEDLAGLDHAQAAVRHDRRVLQRVELGAGAADDHELGERRRRRLLPGPWPPVGSGCGLRPLRFRSISRPAPFRTEGSSAPSDSATSISTRGSRMRSSTGACPTATSSWSTRPERSPCSCRLRPSAPRTTTQRSSA